MNLIRCAGRTYWQNAVRSLMPRTLHHSVVESMTNAEMEKRFVDFFNKGDIDGWDLRQGMNDIVGMDWVPQPEVIIAALNACRRVNEFAIAVRFLEAIKNKCGHRVLEIYPWIVQEITPTLCELGIETPEELGYGKPEMCVPHDDYDL